MRFLRYGSPFPSKHTLSSMELCSMRLDASPRKKNGNSPEKALYAKASVKEVPERCDLNGHNSGPIVFPE
ncbi:hypothetical protein QR680_000439 [Steinernema hermaphroditum]|uniref:Uncharacterized protein n=1 Tax=Steinernema hermaphroditum TaxID=289476 RepID=A0AA39GUL7_9BILA|nr:hypothetical protein QR680_000439 [Steinernema hermaphroditum]